MPSLFDDLLLKSYVVFLYRVPKDSLDSALTETYFLND